MSDVIELIKEYYNFRGYEWPDFNNAMKFVISEIGEAYEVDLARSGNWVRNNPQNKPDFDKKLLAEELGDAIMMLLVAGIVENVDPLDALVNKIKSKMSKVTLMSTAEAEKFINDGE